MFDRYAIKDPKDIAAAVEKREEKREQARAERERQAAEGAEERTAVVATDAVQ